MVEYNVIRDLSNSLKELLMDRLHKYFPDEFNDDTAITFDSPADIDSNSITGTAKLSIFLYDIVENSHFRNNGPIPDGANKLIRSPLTLDLFYLFIPYAPKRETEMMILEKIMLIFYDHAVLKGEVLNNQLLKSGNEEIRVNSHSFSFEEVNKLWERFLNKPFKLSVSYQFTPIKIASEREEMINRVAERVINIHPMED